jgi:hypothetical protein
MNYIRARVGGSVEGLFTRLLSLENSLSQNDRKIISVNKTPINIWVRFGIIGLDPMRFKISPQNYIQQYLCLVESREMLPSDWSSMSQQGHTQHYTNDCYSRRYNHEFSWRIAAIEYNILILFIPDNYLKIVKTKPEN